MLYVSNSTIDTQGKAYVQALQHLTTGCYLSIVCQIGLFAIASGANRIALAALILMIIFLVFVVLYHFSLNAAMQPLIDYIPKNLEAEEEALLSQEHIKASHSGEDTKDGIEASSSAKNGDTVNGAESTADSAEKGVSGATSFTPPPKRGNFLTRYLRPDQFEDYATLRQLVPSAGPVSYEPEAERDAYFHPAITSEMPLLWIPRDEAGVSRQEVAHTGRVVAITDQDSWLDEKGKVHWDIEKAIPPIYEEKPAY